MSVAPVPAALRPATVYIQKGKEMEKADPVVSYYCYYHAIQLVVANRLHLVDEEAKSYSMNLMELLEQKKVEIGENEALSDALVGQIYLEEFALKVLTNADKEMQAQKASKRTAMTLKAAATFMEVSQLSEDPNAEVTAKIKYAKYHAARILKALNAGEDPNLPSEEERNEGAGVPADIEELEKSDEVRKSLASHQHNRADRAAQPDIAIEPPSQSRPPVPLPTTRTLRRTPSPTPIQPPFVDTPARMASADPAPPTAPPAANNSYVPYIASEDHSQAIAASQRHAKWAISALNYEDFATARKELQLAIEQLAAL